MIGRLIDMARKSRRRCILDIIRSIRQDQNDGIVKRALFQLRGVRGLTTSTGGMQQAHVRLVLEDGYELDGYGWDLSRAARGALLLYLKRMRHRRLI